jgi:hypothetical protein
MPSMETLFLVLSGAILAAGVLYWLWSHIQLMQKKVQLLENAVFELRGMLTSGAGGSGPGAPGSGAPSSGGPSNSPAPSVAQTSYKDLADDDWEAPDTTDDVAQVSTPLPVLEVGSVQQVPASEDLMPGGRALLPEEPIQTQGQVKEVSAEQFRELFISSDSVTAASVHDVSKPQTPESLESMPLKELRRLAEQRGIKGSADMRKKEILAALRSQISVSRDEVSVPATVESETLVAEILE